MKIQSRWTKAQWKKIRAAKPAWARLDAWPCEVCGKWRRDVLWRSFLRKHRCDKHVATPDLRAALETLTLILDIAESNMESAAYSLRLATKGLADVDALIADFRAMQEAIPDRKE